MSQQKMPLIRPRLLAGMVLDNVVHQPHLHDVELEARKIEKLAVILTRIRI